MQALALPQPHGKRQSAIKFPIGIVGMAFVDDIRDETEGKRAVYAIAPTMSEAGKPNEWISDFLHIWSTKIGIIIVIFKH